MSVIVCKNLTKKYGKNTALDNLSFKIEENSITGLIGRNGSGKTTLMKILNGINAKDSGEVKVLLEEPMGNIDVISKMIYSFHNFPYNETYKLKNIITVYDTIFEKFDKEFAYKLMDYFELSTKARYKSLSQGMKAMFNFSMALATRSEITMLDEPTLGMDASVRKNAYDILLRDYYEHPRNFIISSHMLNEFDNLLSDIILIDKGKLVVQDDVENIRQMVYRVDGDIKNIKEFTKDKKVILTQSGEIQTFAIIKAKLTKEIQETAKTYSLEASNVRVEDACIYLTNNGKEEELKCLWNEMK